MRISSLATHLGELLGHDLANQPAGVMQQLRAMKKCDVTGRLGEHARIPALVRQRGL